MKVRLGARLLAAFFVVATAGLTVASFLVARSVERALLEEMTDRLRYEVTMTGQMTASALFAPLERDDVSLVGPIHDLGEAVHTHLSIVSPDGTVVADSASLRAGDTRSVEDASEVRDAIAFGRGEAVRGTGASARLWVAEAVRRDGELLGIARASMPIHEVEAHMKAVRRDLAVGAAVALLVATALGVFLTIGIVRPVRKLADAARRIGKGELGARAALATRDEIGDLGRALDDMAGELQKMVASLDAQGANMRCVLDGVDQGLVSVGLDGRIAAERSARLDAWFDAPLAGSFVWDLFPDLSETARLSFRLGWEEIGADVLPLELVLDQLPARVASGGRTFALRYLPLGEPPAERRILVVVSDVTAELAAEDADAVQRDLLRIVERTMKDRESVTEFLRDADDLVARITRGSPPDVLHDLHTLKGNAGVFGVSTVATACHDLETVLSTQERPPTETERAELGARWSRIRESMLALLGDADDRLLVTHDDYVAVLRAVASGTSPALTTEAMLAWRRTPVARAFERLGDHAEALAQRLGKRISVTSHGGAIRVDGETWGDFFAALVHAVRNAVDHGIEAPHERRALGKPAGGTVELGASLEGDAFVVWLSDDGRGIDWAAIARELSLRGLPATSPSELEVGLYCDGLSTREDVTAVSGRGIGMSALRRATAALGGRIEITSETTRGTTLRCVFPRATVALDAPRLLARELGCPSVAAGAGQCLCLPPCLPCLATVLPSFLCDGLAATVSSLAPPALGDARTISS